MKNRLGLFLVVAVVLVSARAKAETLLQYVTACQNDLGFTDIQAMNCNDGVRFAFNPTGGLVNDFVGYQRVNNYVDVTFACRWLGPVADHGPFQTAASVELLVTNRKTGHTCFFAAQPKDTSDLNGVSVAIVPPTYLGAVHPNAMEYWMTPTELNTHQFSNTAGGPTPTLKCVACHEAGPYIASPRIAPALAQFGLLNDGHDDFVKVNGVRRYHAVSSDVLGSAFYGWDGIVDTFVATNTCANGCHSIGDNAADGSHFTGILGFAGESLIPSLESDITDVINAGLMPQGTRKLNDDYRWMNVDIPDDPNTTGDVEVFYDLKANWVGFTPTLNAQLTCEVEPAYMEARVVGSNVTVRSDQATATTTGFPDVLEKFDQTGLICRNASQSDGMCSNYAVRFMCLKDQLSVYSRWTGRALTIANADANNVRYAKGQPYNSNWGPLSQTWHIAGLNDGTTHYNYVRFFNPWSSLYLNADDSLLVTNANLTTSWLSEQWVMERVPGTPYARFRNLWKTNMYLTMNDSSDYSAVNLQPLHTDAYGNPDWWSQQWLLQ
jgi:Mucin-2 protein WxxW repeating region